MDAKPTVGFALPLVGDKEKEKMRRGAPVWKILGSQCVGRR
jgi:hypothetical protein